MKPIPLAYKMFGKKVEKKPEKVEALARSLREARIPIAPEQYLANIYFYALIAGIVGVVAGIVLGVLIVFIVGLPPAITKIPKEALGPLWEFRSMLIFLMIAGGTFGGLYGGTLAIGPMLPGSTASGRKKRINRLLPYAVTYMYAMTKGGMNIIQMFRSLAQAKDTYGEVSNEIRTVINSMDFFGMDLREALQTCIETTPSKKLQDLLHSLLTVIDSGGNVSSFFQDRSEQYLASAVFEQKGFLETLGLMAESYVTAFVAGPLFIVIIQTVIALIGQGGEIVLYAIIYMMLPVGSVMFLVTIKIMTPADTGEATPLSIDDVIHTDFEVPEDSEEKPLFDALLKSRKAREAKEKRNLWKLFMEKPTKTIIFSGPLGAAVFTILLIWQFKYIDKAIDDILLFTVIAMVAPMAFFVEAKARRERRLKKEIPDFFHRLALTNEIGMTVSQSVILLSKQKTGVITKEIRRIARDVEWGVSVNDAFARFANRVRVSSVSRSVKLLTQALKSSGDIRDVLEVTAKDARTSFDLERDRGIAMLIYVVIIYMSFGVFTIVVLIMSGTFLGKIAEVTAKSAASGGGASAGALLGGIDVEFYKRIFYHAAVIMGGTAGLMAGQMGEGRTLAGLKHSCFMLFGAWFMFRLFI